MTCRQQKVLSPELQVQALLGLVIEVWCVAKAADGSRAEQQSALDEIQDVIESKVAVKEFITKDNPFLGLFGGGKSRRSSRKGSSSGRGKELRNYHIEFVDVCGNDRIFNLDAYNKTDARAKAKSYLRKDNENLQGAQLSVELDDDRA